MASCNKLVNIYWKKNSAKIGHIVRTVSVSTLFHYKRKKNLLFKLQKMYWKVNLQRHD